MVFRAYLVAMLISVPKGCAGFLPSGKLIGGASCTAQSINWSIQNSLCHNHGKGVGIGDLYK